MDQTMVVEPIAPLLASLGICAALVGMFMYHAYRTGALKKLGRKPMSNREFFAFGAMAMVPPLACLAALSVGMVKGAMENPALLALGMAACAFAGHCAMSALAKVAIPDPGEE